MEQAAPGAGSAAGDRQRREGGRALVNAVGIEKPNILIVDDVPANLMILSEMIKELGYMPRPVVSVRQAQDAVKKRCPI